MSLEAKSTQSKSRRLIIVVLAVLAIVGLVVFALTRGTGERDDTAAPAPVSTSGSPVASPSPSLSSTIAPEATPTVPAPAPTSPVASAPATPAGPAGCTDVAAGFVPTRFTIDSLGADERVVALNLDDKGNIAAPPFDEPRTASWWSGGPKPGSGEGKALLSIHTYNDDLPPALGNELYAGGESQLQPGDVIRLYGPDGQVACYEFTDAKKVWVKDYDPNSDVMVDFTGPEQLAIIICWDFDKGTRNWDSRIFFYADPVTS